VDGWLEHCSLKGNPWRRGDLLIQDPPLDTDSGNPVVKALQNALREQGLDPNPKGVSYGTDASKICLSGTPCVVFGPGDFLQAHTKDEWILLSEVRKATEIINSTVKHLDDMFSNA
jgi:acetylornithine deacetylase